MQKLIGIFAALVLSGLAHAADTVTVKDAWVRAPAPGAQITAAYMTLEATEPTTLVGASSTAAAAVEVHTMTMANGVMKMREVKTLDLKPGKIVKLEPGGLHLMLIDLKHPLKVGDSVNVVLNFNGGKQPKTTKELTIPVKTAP